MVWSEKVGMKAFECAESRGQTAMVGDELGLVGKRAR